MSSTWKPLDEIRDEENNLVALINYRRMNRGIMFSYCLLREFERNGLRNRTSHLNEHQVEPSKKLIDRVNARIREARDACFEQLG